MEKNYLSRRDFLGKSAATTGMVAVGAFGFNNTASAGQSYEVKRLPREVWVASITQRNLKAETPAL